MAGNYYITIDREKVFVSEEVYKTYRQMKRQERTQAEMDARNGLISYEMFTTETIQGEDLLCDSLQPSVEETALSAVMCCKLYICIDKLSPEERELINRIYFLGYSLRQLSVETGIPYMTIQLRKVKILAKLKNLWKAENFFVQLRSELAYKG